MMSVKKHESEAKRLKRCNLPHEGILSRVTVYSQKVGEAGEEISYGGWHHHKVVEYIWALVLALSFYILHPARLIGYYGLTDCTRAPCTSHPGVGGPGLIYTDTGGPRRL